MRELPERTGKHENTQEPREILRQRGCFSNLKQIVEKEKIYNYKSHNKHKRDRFLHISNTNDTTKN